MNRRCEACADVTVWVECEVLDRIEVFSVSLLDTTSRRFVCLECGDDLDPAVRPGQQVAQRATVSF